jgi:hypothetical protein
MLNASQPKLQLDFSCYFWRMVKFGKIFLILVLFSHCGKKTSSFPEVRINAPSPGDSFEFSEWIQIKATLQHEDLRAYRVSLISETESAQYFVRDGMATGERFELTQSIQLDHATMPGGKYKVRVTAFTEDDQASAERSITYIRKPMETDGLWVVGDNGNSYDLGILPFSRSPIWHSGLIGQRVMAASVMEPNVIITAPQFLANARVYDGETGDFLYSIARQEQTSFPYFTALSGYNDRYVLSNYLGFTEVREASGSMLHNIELEENIISRMSAFGHEYYFKQTQNILNPSISEWVVYNRLGTRFGERLTQDSAVAAFSVSSTVWWVLYNDANGAGFDRFTAGTGAREKFIGQMSGRAITGIQLSPTRYILATTNGVFEVRTQQSGIISHSNLGIPKHLAYDELQNRLAVLKDGQIDEYNIANMQLIRSVPVPTNAKFVGYTYKRE